MRRGAKAPALQKTRGDKLGDVVKKTQTFTYDQGVGGGTENTWYYYNKEGKLEYVDYDTPASGQDLEFTYDGLGRRIMVRRGTATVTNGQVSDFSAAETKKYVYLGGSVIRELLVVDEEDVVAKEYMRGLDMGGGIGSIIYQKKSSDYYYYHYNHKGDVVALTDADGKLAAFYEYDAWGNVMTEAEKTGVDNPYRYSTKEWDEKSGLYYFGARYYSPEIGRWTQRDPAGIVDGLNLYSYVGNDPIGSADTWGGERIKVSEREWWGQWYNPKECLVTYTVGEFVGICPTCACYLECTSKRRDYYHSTYFREVPDPGETWIIRRGGSRLYEIRMVVKSQTKWVDVGSTMIDTPKELKFGPHTDLFHTWCRMKCLEWANRKKAGWKIEAREWGSKRPGETIPRL